MSIIFEPIGIIHTDYTKQTGVPIQSIYADEDAVAWIELDEKYVEGLADLEGFSHLHLLFYLDRSEGYNLSVTPFKDTVQHGLFATRSPRRPNPIGLSIVRLERIKGNILHIKQADMIEGTPLLDIKPFNPDVDHRSDCRIGWMEGKFDPNERAYSDGRFGDEDE